MKILIVIPAYNEEKIIKENLIKTARFLKENLRSDDYQIVLADNNSKDNTKEITLGLINEYLEIKYFFAPQPGKGNAVISAWQHYQNDFDYFIFMDADLATDLKGLILLVDGLKQGNDLVIGSRYLPDSRVKRTMGRRIFSLAYRLFIKILLKTKIKDMPCGFKAINQKIVRQILPLIQNHSFFFDTELVYLAEKQGYQIKEIPVIWQEPRTKENKSRVNLAGVSWQYLKELWRLRSKK
jgi:glycosyltransferase involved in cell wall biosynthesis